MSNSFSTSSGIVSSALETFDGIFTISTTYLPKKSPSTVFPRWGFELWKSPFGEDFQFDDYFSDGLVQPPTSFPVLRVWTFSEFRHQERKKSSDEAASMTPKEIFRSADLCWGTSCCFLL